MLVLIAFGDGYNQRTFPCLWESTILNSNSFVEHEVMLGAVFFNIRAGVPSSFGGIQRIQHTENFIHYPKYVLRTFTSGLDVAVVPIS